MILCYAGMNISIHGMLNSIRLPSYAEHIRPPKTGYFDCCAGARIGIEEVYRIPLDKVSDISYGEKKHVVVEPYGESCLRKHLGSGDGFSLYLFSAISIFFILPVVVLYIVLKKLAHKLINKLRNK